MELEIITGETSKSTYLWKLNNPVLASDSKTLKALFKMEEASHIKTNTV